MTQITSEVSKTYKVTAKQLMGKTRKMEVVNARHISMFLCREMTSGSLLSIGKFFGNRDHSTVIHACKMIEEKIAADNSFAKDIKNIKNQLT